VGHCTWYRMEHSIVTVSFKGFYQAKEHGSWDALGWMTLTRDTERVPREKEDDLF
jgi:hypothetical protein